MSRRDWWGVLALAVLVLASSCAQPGPAPLPTPEVAPTRVTPTPRATPPPPPLTPTPSPEPSPTPLSETATLQELVDATPWGGTLVVPPRIFRETLVITRSITLQGQPGAEIRGSDVWTDWQPVGGRWRSEETVPRFRRGLMDACPGAVGRCAWPEQVFYDGEPLVQVAGNPARGEFALTADRHILLADPPAGHVVEVTVRQQWLWIRTEGVVVRGLRMRHAASPAQYGAIQNTLDDNNTGFGRLTLEDNVLSDAHGAAIALKGLDWRKTEGLRLVGNDISYSGQVGVFLFRTRGAIIQDNAIHDNNTEEFDIGWEAGGLKAVESEDLLLADNEVFANNGAGLWCDIDSQNTLIRGNRAHHNTGPGIFYEISDGARIVQNVVYENNRGGARDGWGAGILLSSSRNTEVADNVLAWNGEGITVLSQNRRQPSWNTVDQVLIRNNTVLQPPSGPLNENRYALAWVEHWASVIFDPEANNRAVGNRFWFAGGEGLQARFAWNGPIRSLAAFVATPGGAASHYLTDEEKNALLTRYRLPSEPGPADALGAQAR